MSGLASCRRVLPGSGDAVLLAALLISAVAAVPHPVIAVGNVSVTQGNVSRGAPYNLPMGKVLPLQPPKGFSHRITEGDDIIKAVAENGVLTVTPQKAGRATLIIEAPNYAPVAYSIRVSESEAAPPATPLPASPTAEGTTNTQTPVVTAASTAQTGATASVTGGVTRIGTPLTSPSRRVARGSTTIAPYSGPIVSGGPVTVTPRLENSGATTALPLRSGATSGNQNNQAANENTAVSSATAAQTQTPAAITQSPAAQLPADIVSPSASLPSASALLAVRTPASALESSSGVARTVDALPPLNITTDVAQISPSLPAPARSASPAFPMRSQLPQNVAAVTRGTRTPSNAVAVTQGLARLFRFPNNILAVFFSDVNVMDARAVNARTVAITGLAPGASTLAVFTARYPGDAVGRSHIYQIAVRPPDGASTPALPQRSPQSVEIAIRTALNDPRIGVAVIPLPNGTLAARLTGTVRDIAEIEAARATAALFVPQVVSALYAEKTAPTLDTAGALPSEQQFQAQLRQLTGNNSIEFMTLPSGIALKAEVSSVEEANALLNLLPDLGQPVTPFIVIRGAGGAPPTYYDRPVLSGQDAEMTRRMQTVTGVKTVYAVRVSSNPTTPTDYGIAVYGTVRDRAEYDTVRRFAMLFTQTGGAITGGATNGNINPAEAANLITTGYRQPVGIHMFVRILDGSDAVVRRVTAETSVVEISRTALRNLGVQVGSVALLSETVTPGTPPVFSDNGNLRTPGTPGRSRAPLTPTLLPGN
jgi:hypothetical protein